MLSCQFMDAESLHERSPSLSDAENRLALATGTLLLFVGASRRSKVGACLALSSAPLVYRGLDEKVRGKHCNGIAGIIQEGKSVMEEDFDETTMHACLIAAGQRAEHYEMAAYGTLVAWAQAMGHTEAAKLLQQTLDEEKAADKKLSGLAEGGINQSAADAAHPDDEGEEEPTPASAGRKDATAATARRR
jgi:Domain of unknown function (DUF892)